MMALCVRRTRPDPLVSKERLVAMIGKRGGDGPNDLDTQRKDYMEHRWVSMVMWWHERSMEAKWKYSALRSIIIIGGVSIPVLSAIAINNSTRTCAVIGAAVAGAIVAASAAWEGVMNYGEIWREKRRAAELLKVEGWLFLSMCGKYKDEKSLAEAFPVFVGEVEKMIAAEVGQYLALFDASLAQVKKMSDETVSAIVAEIRKQFDSNRK
jgi:Protein of unknown function (DUF4231)